MKKIVSALVLLVVTLTANAQMPGYLGRRLEVGFDLMMSPHISGGLNNGTFGIPVNMRMGLHVDYAKSRKWTFGLSYTMLPSSFDHNAYGYYDANDNYVNLPIEEHKFKQLSHTIAFRFYSPRNGDLAPPLGFFWGYELGIGIAVAKDVDGTLPDLKGAFTKGRTVTSILPHWDWIMGRKMAFGERWLFSTGVNIGITGIFGGLINYVFYEDGSTSLTEINKNVKRQNALRYYSQDMVSLNFGISYLIK
jgi:hypothetical protein